MIHIFLHSLALNKTPKEFPGLIFGVVNSVAFSPNVVEVGLPIQIGQMLLLLFADKLVFKHPKVADKFERRICVFSTSPVTGSLRRPIGSVGKDGLPGAVFLWVVEFGGDEFAAFL